MKKLVSFVLVLAMIMGCVSVAFAGTTKSKSEINYVPIGDSFSNGHSFAELGVDEDLSEIYAELFAKHLNKEYDEVTVSKDLLLAGIRATDVLAYLGKSEYRDGMTEYWHKNAGSTSPECINAVKNANIISVKLGYNNLINYMSLVIKKDFGLNDKRLEFTLNNDKVENLLTDEQKKMLSIVKSDLTEIVEEAFPEEVLSAINSGVTNILDIKIGADYTIRDYINFLAYAVVGACIDYDNMLDEIYRLNPNVDVFVMELENTIDGFTLTYEIEDSEIEISLGKMIGAALDFFNTYYAVFSKYSDKTYYVKANGVPQTFADQVVTDSAFAKVFTKALLGTDDDVIVKNVQQYLAVSNYSLNDIIDSFANIGASGIESLLSEENITKLLTQDFSKASDTDKLIMKVYLMLLEFFGAGMHPSVEGHATMAKTLEEAYEEHRILDEAVVYHFIIKMIPEDAVKFMYSKTIEEVKSRIELYNKQYAYVKQFCDKIYETINNPTVVTILPETNMVKLSSSTKLVTPKTVVTTIKNKVNTVLGKLFK